MNWKEIGEQVLGFGLPMLGSVLGGPAGGTVGTMVASALGVGDDPKVVAKAIQADPTGAAAKLKELETRHRHEIERLSIEAAITNTREVNQTYRTEITSRDGYVRRMRPTFGYVMAAVIFGLAGVGGYAVVAAPAALPAYAQLVGVLNIPLGAGLAVLGVYVHGRSREKQLDAGHPPAKGLLQTILGR